VNIENGGSGSGVWQREQRELSVESAWSAQSRVDSVGPVGRAYLHHLPARVEAVHQGKKCVHDGGRIWSCLTERTGAKPSISSKKMMER
jgi:hypothetical protein